MTYEKELRFYELLGVRQFRRLVFLLEKFIHRRDNGRNINYHLASFEPQALDRFTKYLFYNGTIHVRNILFFAMVFTVRYGICQCLSVWDSLLWLLFLKDVYCVLLQRYNFIRLHLRAKILRKKQAERIERKAAKILQSGVSYASADLHYDLQFVQQMLTSFHLHKSIFIGEEETKALQRLQMLL